MFFYKKIIILTGDSNNESSGVLKLENLNKKVTCDTRLFCKNLNAFLAIMVNDKLVYCEKAKVEKITLTKIEKFEGEIKAIVFDENGIICKGSTSGAKVSFEYLITCAKNVVAGRAKIIQPSNEIVEKGKDSKPFNEEDNQKENIIESIGASQATAFLKINQEKLTNNSESQALDNDKIEEVTKKTTIKRPKALPVDSYQKFLNEGENLQECDNFYEQIADKLKLLMTTYKKDKELEALMPQSEWVRVPTIDKNFYVVGVINDEGKPKLICYGVPDINSNNPPKCKSEARQWMELEKGGKGYWMMYQDAKTGKTLTSI